MTQKNINSQFILKSLLRGFLRSYLAFIQLVGKRVGRNLRPGQKFVIVVTGQFQSLAWANAHILPLVRCDRVERLIVVAYENVPVEKDLTHVVPSRVLACVFGSAVARLICTYQVAKRERADWVGGFHLLFNGMASALIAKLIRSRSIYFCVGGPTETLITGRSENKLFGKLKSPDKGITTLLFRAIEKHDVVVTMGDGARAYLMSGAQGPLFLIHPGGVNAELFKPSSSIKNFDFVLVGRLTPVKEVELFISAVGEIAKGRAHVSAVIVGDGPCLGDLKNLAAKCCPNGQIQFAGRSDSVAEYLTKSRVFVLTSRSEGVSLAMLEALTAGVPVVVPDVGDLGEAIAPGLNGELVKSRNANDFASAMERVLDLGEYRADEIRLSVEKYSSAYAIKRWSKNFAEVDTLL